MQVLSEHDSSQHASPLQSHRAYAVVVSALSGRERGMSLGVRDGSCALSKDMRGGLVGGAPDVR